MFYFNIRAATCDITLTVHQDRSNGEQVERPVRRRPETNSNSNRESTPACSTPDCTTPEVSESNTQ